MLGAAAGLVPAARAASTQALTEHSVTVAVTQVTPSTPAAGVQQQPLQFQLTLKNTSDQTLNDLVIAAGRGNPISTQGALDAAIASPQPPDPSLVGAVPTKAPVTVSLSPAETKSITFATSAGLSDVGDGLCICHNDIYPIFFSVTYTDALGAVTDVGTAQTFVPAFDAAPPKVRVSWLWPLLDRPHRLTSDTVFIDDALATSVATGRLSRLLQVAAEVGRSGAPMTLVVDPELIDELAVMSTGDYQVRTKGKPVAGTGGPAAREWLATLRSVLQDPGMELDFTPNADPDIEALTRNGLSWRSSLNPVEQARVTAALGGQVGQSDIVWPAGQRLSTDTLATVVRQGGATVVLDEASLTGASSGAAEPLTALAPLQTPSGSVVAAVPAAQIQRFVAPVLSIGGAGLAALPTLVAEVAIRAVTSGSEQGYVVLVPPRNLDPNPAVAARAILDTAVTSWSTALPLRAAVATISPVERGTLISPPGTGSQLPARVIAAAQAVSAAVPALSSMLRPADAATVLGNLPAAVQRVESVEWRSAPALGASLAAELTQGIATFESRVYLVRPSNGTYTLASGSSPLPLTVENDLPYPVKVRLRVGAVNGLPGFSANDVGVREIPARSKLTLQVATRAVRTGRFPVQAALLTPSGAELGQPVLLSVHSTALGTIGIIITIAAAAVLVLALLVRLVRRLRQRGSGPAEPGEPSEPVAAVLAP